MDYYNSQSTQTYSQSQISPNSHGNTSGKSSAAKRISSDIHLFLAQHDEQEEFATRKPSPLPVAPIQKENNNLTKHENNINRTTSLQTLPAQTKPQRISKKEQMTPKKSTDKGEQSKYAGGGYTTSPNPKALTKPSLSSPVKKEKKSENKEENASATKSVKQQKFSHSMHCYSAPNLMPFPSHPLNMIPMPQFVMCPPNYFNGQAQFYESTVPIPSMTREEANQHIL